MMNHMDYECLFPALSSISMIFSGKSLGYFSFLFFFEFSFQGLVFILSTEFRHVTIRNTGSLYYLGLLCNKQSGNHLHNDAYII